MDFRKKASPRSLRKKNQKRSGGQEGHEGHALEQVAKPTKIVVHSVDTCEKCGQSLKDENAIQTIKRQVFDIPEPKIEVTEHQVEVKRCTCGHCTEGTFPTTRKRKLNVLQAIQLAYCQS